MTDLRIIFFFLLSFTGLTACYENSSSRNLTMEYPGVDSRLWPYFDRFEKEAASRGIELAWQEIPITAGIHEIDDPGIAGQCGYGGNLPANRIIIDLQFWNNSHDLAREFVVFHELGHCMLFRGHLEDSFTDGSCVSIMRSGTGPCWDAFSPDTRSYYLDELFLNRN